MVEMLGERAEKNYFASFLFAAAAAVAFKWILIDKKKKMLEKKMGNAEEILRVLRKK